MKKLLIFILFIFPFYSLAGIQVNNNKFTYIEGSNNPKIEIKNTSDQSYFIQSSVTHTNDKNDIAIPFVISPPLFKLNANETFFLDIIKVDNIEINNKESLYKLNIKSVPIVEKEAEGNLLHISLNMIYNLFYRPKELNDKEKAYEQIEFYKNDLGYLVIKNPTPYYMTLNDVKNADTVFIDGNKTLAPFLSFNTKKKIVSANPINYNIKNDYENVVAMPGKKVSHEE